MKSKEPQLIEAYSKHKGDIIAAYRAAVPMSKNWKDETVEKKAIEFFSQEHLREKLGFEPIASNEGEKKGKDSWVHREPIVDDRPLDEIVKEQKTGDSRKSDETQSKRSSSKSTESESQQKKTKKKSKKPAVRKADPNELSQAEEDFAQEYVANGGDRAKAYRVAYPHSKEWQSTALWPQASREYRKPKVHARVQELRKKIVDRTLVTESRALLEAGRIAFADARNLFDDEGKIKAPAEWTDDVAAMVQHVKIGKDGRPTDVRLWNKTASLDKIFRHLGLYEKDNAQKNPVTPQLENLPLELLTALAERLQSMTGEEEEIRH